MGYFNQHRKKQATQQQEDGIVLVTILTFIPLLAILATVAISVGLQANQSAILQQYKEQAQLASTSAMDFAKEQYEIDVDYKETPETELYRTDQYRVTYEVVHDGYSNEIQTQQDIRGIGRVYKLGSTTARVSREIRGKITYTSGGLSGIRFVFIVDNSSSMNVSDWQLSKGTVDASIIYVLNSVDTAEVAVVQYATSGSSIWYNEHKYDVTIPFTSDKATATTWNRRYGQGTAAYYDGQDHLAGSLARMRQESVYGPGDELDLAGAKGVQYVLFTDASGDGPPYPYEGVCCSSLKRTLSDPVSWHNDNGPGFTVLNNYDEYNALKDGTVYADDGYPGLSSQWTLLSVFDDDNNLATTSAFVTNTRKISAAIASPGGGYIGEIDPNPGDPEGGGTVPRRLINTSLTAGPEAIIDILAEIIETEINF